MAEPFVTTNRSIDVSSLKQEYVELLQARFPGWEPSAGDLLTWISEGSARIAADVFEQMTQLEQAAFKRYGEAIAGVPPVQAAPATVQSVWTMVDELGHEIEAGTQVGIPGAEGTPEGFETVGDVVVPPGSTKATILLQAIEPGEAGNGLSGTPQLETALSFVESPTGIELEGVTAGGVDEEEEAAYLNRLVETLRLLSISLILPENFEVDARSYAGIARAKCIRTYNAETKEEGVPLCQTVFPIGPDGEPVSETIKAALLAGQKEKLISGVLHFVADADYTQVDVTASFKVEAGFDPETITAAVKARLEEYLSPQTWGLPSNGEGSGWINRTSVYRNELISLVDRVGGVDRVVNVELAKHGSELGTAEELALTGVAPLTKPGTLEVKAI